VACLEIIISRHSNTANLVLDWIFNYCWVRDMYEVNLGKGCHEISLFEMDYDIDYKEGGLPCPMLIIVIVRLLTHNSPTLNSGGLIGMLRLQLEIFYVYNI
jgi:hypothetical protein